MEHWNDVIIRTFINLATIEFVSIEQLEQYS